MRLVLGLLLVMIAVPTWRRSRAACDAEQTQQVEARSYLLFLAGAVLLALNVVSWPVLYLLLQSYVREWPAIMCIYGVTQIGAGSPGLGGWLPVLLAALQWVRLLVLFLSGAVAVLYLINRRTLTGAILSSVVLAVLLTGIVSLVDAATELAWLTIPKQEITIAGGCCTNTLDAARRAAKFTPVIRIQDEQRPVLVAAYYALNLTLIVSLLVRLIFRPERLDRRWSMLLLIGSLASLPVSLQFLIDIAAPAILGLPFHHCAYDLIGAAPESMVSVVLFVLGICGIGWAFVAERFGGDEQTGGFLQEYVLKLLFIGWFGYSGSLLMISVELLLV